MATSAENTECNQAAQSPYDRSESVKNGTESGKTATKSAKARNEERALKDKVAVDRNQEEYRKKFGIVDKYLIGMAYNSEDDKPDGYIVYIDYDNDLNYIDCRNLGDEERKKQQQCIARLQHAEASQTKHLPESQQMDFKRMLGVGYVQVMNGNYEQLDEVINEAKTYLKKRNREHSRYLFLVSGLPAAIVALITGFILYLNDIFNPWLFGFIFGILGAFVSIWTRYGKVQFTGQARCWLHMLECYSRIIIGSIFSLIAMTAIKCQLIFPEISVSAAGGKEQLYAFIIVSFIAAFSERFIPSIVERITNESATTE